MTQETAMKRHFDALMDAQNFVKMTGMKLLHVEHGLAEYELPVRDDLLQHSGYVHGGMVSAFADTVGGTAAFSVMPKEANGLSVEYKINFIAPAKGEKLIGRGRVIKAGRTLIITSIEIFAVDGDKETLCALCQQTMICLMPGK